LYAAITLQNLEIPKLEQVKEVANIIQSVLSQYKDSEAKDIRANDLTMLLAELKRFPNLQVIEDNTTDKSNLKSNLVVVCIETLKQAIPMLSKEHDKHYSHTTKLTLKPH